MTFDIGMDAENFLQALTLWEDGCDMIEKREDALSRLEAFERAASDPTRFFAKGLHRLHVQCHNSNVNSTVPACMN